MNSFVNPFTRQASPPVFAHAAEVKRWARQALALDQKVIISVNEIACPQPGCPPQETVILVLRAGSAVKLSIHKALADVIEADVVDAARNPEALEPSSATVS